MLASYHHLLRAGIKDQPKLLDCYCFPVFTQYYSVCLIKTNKSTNQKSIWLGVIALYFPAHLRLGLTSTTTKNKSLKTVCVSQAASYICSFCCTHCFVCICEITVLSRWACRSQSLQDRFLSTVGSWTKINLSGSWREHIYLLSHHLASTKLHSVP